MKEKTVIVNVYDYIPEYRNALFETFSRLGWLPRTEEEEKRISLTIPFKDQWLLEQLWGNLWD